VTRDDVTSTKLVKDSDITDVAGVAINTTNGTRVLATKWRKTIIMVTNTSASTRVVTVRKATNAQDIPADYSTIAIPVTTGVEILGPFSGRYIQADGGIYLDFVSGHTGAVKAYELPN